MKVQIGNVTFYCKWRHYNNNEVYKIKGTECSVKIVPSNSEKSNLYFKSFSPCSENINFDKNIGRKKSLKRILKDISLFNKEHRGIVWKAYLNLKTKSSSIASVMERLDLAVLSAKQQLDPIKIDTDEQYVGENKKQTTVSSM